MGHGKRRHSPSYSDGENGSQDGSDQEQASSSTSNAKKKPFVIKKSSSGPKLDIFKTVGVFRKQAKEQRKSSFTGGSSSRRGMVSHQDAQAETNRGLSGKSRGGASSQAGPSKSKKSNVQPPTKVNVHI